MHKLRALLGTFAAMTPPAGGFANPNTFQVRNPPKMWQRRRHKQNARRAAKAVR